MITKAAGLTDAGCKRQANQDRILVDVERGVFVIADGMGGERCGELAAETAVRSVGESLLEAYAPGDPRSSDPVSDVSPKDRVVNAVRCANQKIWEASEADTECAGMGTTLSVALLVASSVVVGNVGDSRVYLFRDAQLRRLTRDDAVVSMLVDAGKISAEKARVHPMRNVLTLAVGRSREMRFGLRLGF